jgi:uncharacterized membrane protein YfcA
MILVLGLVAIVALMAGAVLGALIARFLPVLFLYVFWAVLLAVTAYQVLQLGAPDEFDRAGANIVIFAVLLPLLGGSLLSGIWVRRHKT